MLEAFRALQRDGLGVLDVGSRGGVHPVLAAIAPLLDVVGLEPDQTECQRLAATATNGHRFKSLRYLPYALGETDREGTLHLCRAAGSSSLYKPNRSLLDRFPDEHRYDVVGTVNVPIRSIDSLRQEAQLPRWLDFFKIDTQGSELQVLRGAAQTLRHQVVAIEVEVEFAALYEGQPLFRDVDAFLASFGFMLFKLRRQEWVRRALAARSYLSAGQVVFGEALYLRDPLGLPQGDMFQEAHHLEALILLATRFDLHDFALELLSTPQVANRLEAPESIRQWIERRSRKLASLTERLRTARAWYGANGSRRYAARWGRGDHNFYSVL